MPTDLELLKALKNIKVENLMEEDKEELLKFFVVAEQAHIRNRLAFILSDAKYNKAIPFIIAKINEKSLTQFNGSLVYALEKLDVKGHFIEIVKMICELEYEPRYQAYEIVCRVVPDISDKVKNSALAMLEERRKILEELNSDAGIESPLHFVEQTIKLLLNKQE